MKTSNHSVRNLHFFLGAGVGIGVVLGLTIGSVGVGLIMGQSISFLTAIILKRLNIA